MKRDTKSPLTNKPLRNPGQSIDEAIDKLFEDEMFKYALIPPLAISFTAMEWWRWYTNMPYTPKLYTVMTVLATAVSVYKILKLRKKLANLRLGRDGERAIGQYLELLREKGYKIFHDIVGEKFNIDHVIICQHGIFTVETKTYSKPMQGKATVKYDGESITINGNQPIKDILTQARAEASWLKNMLKESAGKDVPVKPIVVFPGWYVDNSNAGFNPDVWVLNPKAISDFLSKSRMSLSPEDVSLFAFHISRYIRSTYSVE